MVFNNEIFVGRYGGDEFIVFLDEIEEQDVLDYINQVENLMNRFNSQENLMYRLSCASGYGITTTDNKTMTMKEIFDIADAQMYKNKISMKKKNK